MALRKAQEWEMEMERVPVACMMCGEQAAVVLLPVGERPPKKICHRCKRKDDDWSLLNDHDEVSVKSKGLPPVEERLGIKTLRPGDPEFEEVAKQYLPPKGLHKVSFLHRPEFLD